MSGRQLKICGGDNLGDRFNKIELMEFPGMNKGIGTMSTRMYNYDSYRIIPTSIHPGGSIGNHKQELGDEW